MAGALLYSRPQFCFAGIQDNEMQDQMMNQEEKRIQPNSKNYYEVTKADLPLSCPMPEMYTWNSHPKVYLPIEETGTAMCPYCSATYHLQEN